MIVRILSQGKSFKGLADYLTHDAGARTAERVAWTHTLNLANDHVPSATDEMLWTARNAELLKQEAGIRAGGRSTENAVKHLSLNWAPGETPTRDHMIATAEEFLRHMKWHEYQTIIVAHDDKAYRHVHLMINVIHPETGLRLDDNFEWRRAQAWAREYERENGRIYCEQRLLPVEEREKAVPRNIWMAFHENEKEFGRTEEMRANDANIASQSENRGDAAWEKLKVFQRLEREQFFQNGKSEFRELRAGIFREIREEFREHWAQFYDAKKKKAFDPVTLSALKAGLVENQNALLTERRDAACKELRQVRDEKYRGLLNRQLLDRAELRTLQALGLDTQEFMAARDRSGHNPDRNAEFRATADEMSARFEPRAHGGKAPEEPELKKLRPLHLAPVLRLASPLGTLLDDLINLGSTRPEPMELGENEKDPFQEAAEETLKQEQGRAHERDEEERARRLSLHEREQ